MAKQVRVKPIDSVPQEEIKANILKNLQLITSWDSPCKVHMKQAWIMSAGPSLRFATETMFTKDYFDRLGDSKEIFCIKHALPVLRDAGITPFACVALDPRPISGLSTHGVLREDLYSAAPRETLMFIASMTHPSVTEYLLERGYRVIGWHAAAGAIDELINEGKMNPVLTHAGGTCSAMRCISVAHNMGFRRANLVGFDSSLESEPENKDEEVSVDTPDGKQKNKSKYIDVYNPKDKDHYEFWTTGELVAQAQDIEKLLLNQHLSDMEVRFYATDKGRSYGGNIVETTPNYTIRKTFEERYKG